MALFSNFKREDPMAEGPPRWPVDLAAFKVGPHRLGEGPDSGDLWGRLMQGDMVCKPEGTGIELGLKQGAIDYALVDLAEFEAGFLRDGEELKLDSTSTEAQVREIFGEPYWTDRSDGEVILFYEFDSGRVELQFEFPDAGGLGFVTLARDGVMSDASQRAAYGCDYPWPPA